MKKFAIALSLLFLWACGGGGGSKAPTEPVEPAPVSNFTATSTSGLQPLEVVFTSTATGTITSYAWNVDNDPAIEGTTATYTHTYTEVGTYSVTLTVTGPGGSNPKTVADMITVSTAAPTPTTATSQTVQEDGSATISLTATDPNGQAITFAISTEPTNGTATLSGTDITYVPNANFYGTDSFAYTASNGTYTSDPVTITITVEGEDDGNPTTNDVSATTDEDTAVTVNLDATEIDGDNYSFSIISQPTNGTLGGVSGNQVEYTPNENFNGTDTFTFEATDDRTLRRNVATVTITVNAINDAPVANDITSQVTDENRMMQLDITLDATDVDGDALTYSIVDTNNGTVTVNGSTANYTPNQDWNGEDTFTYKANDGNSDSNTATVTVTVNAVNDAPVTSEINATTDEDVPIDITLIGSDVDGDNLTYSIVSNSNNATIVIDGSVANYTPPENSYGNLSFTYKANDGELDSNVSLVNINVAFVNDPPIAKDMTVNTTEDGGNTGEHIQFKLDATDSDSSTISYAIVDDVSNGTLTFVNDESVLYVPNQDYNGTDTFTFQANDGNSNSNIATVTINIGSVNDAPVTQNISFTTDEDTPYTDSFTGNVSDVDGDNLTITAVTNPTNGTATCDGTNCTYTPNQDFNGTDSFTYKVNDGELDSNVSTVSVTINPVNDAPTTNDVSTTIDENRTANRLVGITLDGSDIEGDALTYSVVSDASNGTTSISGATLTYTANQDWNGTETITYKANDGSLDSNISTITIIVNAVNDAPVIQDQGASTNEDTAVTKTLSVVDVDTVQGMTRSIVSNPSNGSVVLSGSGNQTATYTPNANWNGTDTFTWKANDGTLDSNTATLTITVAAVNDAPATTNISTTTAYETVTNITLSGTDIDGDTLTYSIVSDVSNGSTSLSGSTVSYTPNSTWSGTDTFTYKANDGTADSNTATVTITVNADDAPASSFTADETTGFTPLRVVFTNASTNSTSYNWDFGDGNTSTDTNPAHTFSNAGTYTVSLTATGSGGSDSSIETITVSALPNSSLITDPKYIINNSTSAFDIKVNQVTNLTSAQLVLNIPAGMSIDSVTAGSFLEGNTAPLMILTDNVSSDGTYTISISSLSSDLQSASGDGILATVTFTNNNSASSNITFNSNTKFLDNDGNTISINQAIGVFLVTE